MITIMGATGHTGRRIAEQLLLRGEPVRALGRSEGKLGSLSALGAEIAVGDVADAEFLTQTFRGSDAVYTLLPTDRRSEDYLARQQDEGRAVASAIRDSGTPFVVALSSLGADVPAGTGLIAGLHAQEQRLCGIDGISLCLLRPVSFFENVLEQIPSIMALGVLADSVAPDIPFPMVAAREVAHAAVDALLARDWTGVTVRELLGPRDLTHRQIAALLGRCLGQPDLPYVQLPYTAMANALVEAGFSASFARLYCEMTQAFNEGRVQPRATTARRPRSKHSWMSIDRRSSDRPAEPYRSGIA